MSNNKEKVVGKGSILIPALKPTGYYSKQESDASPECRASPSPCSSTTLSFLSTTSDEFVLPSESAFEETERRNSKWKPRDTMKDFSYLRPSEKDFVSSLDKRSQNTHVSVPISYDDFHKNATFQGRRHEECEYNNVSERDIKISSFSGIKLCPQIFGEVDSIKTKNSQGKGEINCRSTHDLRQIRGETKLKQNKNDFPYMMEIPRHGGVVSISSERTLTPPPDFIEPTTSESDDVKTKSCQPNLDMLLSGAVRSSALLRKKSDFVPAALMPREMMRQKCKSLSDLSKREKKTKRFLDRRKVIKMNLEDKDCCSHTEVSPSSMMTLAAELLVSKNSKAARLFSEARRKADDEGSEHESILPKLWVVPKPSIDDADKKTASHLKPLINQESTTSEKINNDAKKDPHTVLLRGTKNRETLSNVKATSRVSCTPLSKQTVENYGKLTNERSRIHSEDIQRDLMTLTVADLVGTPDTVYTDTESEFDERDCFQPRRKDFATNTGPKPSNGSKVKCRKEDKRTQPACLNETTSKPGTLLFEKQHCLTATNRQSRGTGDSDPHRCSSVSSNSSSLTTVSSLTLSSNSLGSPDHPQREALQILAKQQDSELESKKQVQDHCYKKPNNKAVTPKMKFSKNCNELLKTDSREAELEESGRKGVYTSTPKTTICTTDGCETSRVIPKVPVRKNSIKVMDKLRKRHIKIIEAKAERAKMQPNANQDVFTAASESCQAEQQGPVPGDNSKHLSLHENALSPVTLKGLPGSSNTVKYLRETAQLKRSDKNHKQRERICHPSSLLISSEGYRPETDSLHKARDNTLGYTQKPEPFPNEIVDDAYCITKKDNRKIQQTARILADEKCWNAETEDCLVSKRAAEECWGGRRTAAKDIQQLLDMPTETFRNGEISVVDGSKISLTNQVSLVKSSGKNNDQFSSSLYLSDLLDSQKKSEPDISTTHNEEVLESILLPTSAAPLQSSYEQPLSETVENSTTDTAFIDRSVPSVANLDTIERADFSPTKERKAEIVRTSDLDNYFPEYKSVIVPDSDKMRSESVSHNICAKPFSKNLKTHQPNYNDVDSRHTKSLQSLYPSTTGSKNDGNIYPDTENISGGKDISLKDDLIKICHQQKSVSEASSPRSSSATNMTSSQTKKEGGKNSAMKLLTGDKNVYSSCVKITLSPNASEIVTKKDVEEVDSRLDFGRINMVMRRPVYNTKPKVDHSTHRRRSFPMKNDRGKSNSKHVREVKTPEMKSTENPESFVIQPDIPAHSQVDEGDFAGVVDGPSKNVKEIRAMFKKGPDYADYAKPKLVLRKPATQTRSKSPDLPTSRPQSTEVAQQIIGLFKGALTLEVDDKKTDTPEKTTTVIQNGETNATHEDEHISLKDKVASFNVGKSPVKENEVNNNINDDITISKSHRKDEEKGSYVEIITNPTPTTNGDLKKTVQQEKVSADSYDESLDQFYDILDELSSS